MLKKINKGLKIAMLAIALGVPVYAQSYNEGILTGMNNNRTITLNISEISVEDAVKMVCEHFGYTPMIHIPLADSISINFSNASFDQAMEKILGDNSSYMVENNNLHVFKQRKAWNRISDQPSNNNNLGGNSAVLSEPAITRIVPLGKRAAADIHKLVRDLNLKISAVYDSPTNSIIFMGPESQVTEAETFCRNIDAMPIEQTATDSSKIVKGLKYVTRTYELEHADFEEIETELDTIIQRDSNSTSGSSTTSAKDKDGNPIDTEYFLLNKSRRIVIIHTSPEKFAVIDEYFKAINKPLAQVLIETTIVALDDGLEKQLGIKWNGFEGTSGYSAPLDSTAIRDKNLSNDRSLVYPKDWPANSYPTYNSFKDWVKYGGTWNVSSVQALLRAVETDTKSQILSKPRIMSVTGETSSIHVGDEIPYTSGTTVTDGGNTTSSVSFKEVGIKLDVTPTVNVKDNTIQMKVVPEVSQWVRDVVMGNNRVPQVSTRKAESTIKIENGQTIVIGGLIESKSVNDIYKIPILGSLPLVGKAFRSKNTSNTKTNLIILLTAHIMDNNSRNTLSHNAVREINESNPLKKSKALAEIVKPVITKPDVYGKDIKFEEENNFVEEEKASINNKTKVSNNIEKTRVLDSEERRKIIEELRNKSINSSQNNSPKIEIKAEIKDEPKSNIDENEIKESEVKESDKEKEYEEAKKIIDNSKVSNKSDIDFEDHKKILQYLEKRLEEVRNK